MRNANFGEAFCSYCQEPHIFFSHHIFSKKKQTNKAVSVIIFTQFMFNTQIQITEVAVSLTECSLHERDFVQANIV